MARLEVLNQLADLIVSIVPPHPTRVAIDGVDAAGKTTIANELVNLIETRGRQVIRASIDRFHRSRAERYQHGADSPEGYYLDSFNHAAIRAELLEPLGPGGNRHYRRAVFDFRSDAPAQESTNVASADAILLFDGVFLLRPELNDCWDYRVFVQVDFEIAVPRAIQRDLSHGALAGDIDARYWKRYVPGQRIYLQTARPQEQADVIIENNDPDNPRLLLCNHTLPYR